ncbi:MAG: ABC transporter permease [Acidimicrobiia bacterium]|nr:ABC transporter permease [Acidimicrobiia bacterium]
MARRPLSPLRAAVVVARQDLRRRLRNRSALVTAVLGPLAMAIVFGSLIEGASGGTLRLGVVDADRSASSAAVLDALVGGEGFEDSPIRFESVADEAEARRRVDDGDLGAALVIASGFGTAGSPGERAELVVVRDPDQVVSGQVVASVAASIAAGVERAGLAVATAAALSGAPPTPELVSAAIAVEPSLALGEVDPGGRAVSAAAFYGAAMSILFLFFTVGYASRSVLVERQDGTLDRMLATPVSPGAILAGKAASVGVLGLVGFVVVWLVTSSLFDAPWGEPLAVVVLMVATVFAITGVATFAASLARTERQADAITSAVAFVLALLGGNFVGPNLPAGLRRLSVLTPNGWSLQAFVDLNADAVGLRGIAGALVVLLAMGVVFGAVGVVRVRRVMLP